MKFLNIGDKKRFCEFLERKKKNITYKGSGIRTASDFSAAVSPKILKANNIQLTFIYLVK